MTAPNALAVPVTWDLVADAYTDELAPIFSRYAEDALALAAPRRGDRLLDVAAGPGTLSLLAAPRVARVTAIDFSAAMLARLREACAARRLDNVHVHFGDGQALPFADASFDCAFSMFGLMFFPDRAAGFHELRRVLVAGGRAVVSTWAPLDRVPLLAAMFSVLREVAPAPASPTPATLPLNGADQLRTEMAAAGFHDVVIHSVAHQFTVPSVAELWASNERSSAPIAALKRQMAPAEWTRISAVVLERMRDRFGDGRQTLDWPALLGVGLR